MKNLINIGIPSKGRLRKDVLKIFTKKRLKLISERGERDLIGSIKNKSNIKILYLHAREIIERLGDGSLDIGFSGFDLLKESEINTQNKINVITPNKALISKHGDYLSNIAERKKVNLEFEASVGGGIPILRTIKEGLSTNRITKVYGILNGTCNYILSEMDRTNDNFKNSTNFQNLNFLFELSKHMKLNLKTVIKTIDRILFVVLNFTFLNINPERIIKIAKDHK